MRKLTLIIGSAAILLGCGSNVVSEFEGIVKEVCACKDAECANKAAAKLDDLGKKFKGKEKDFSDADKKKMGELLGKMTECQTRLTGGSAVGDYISKSKSTEAMQFVKKLVDGARAYYMDNGNSAASLTPLPRQFPGPSIGPTPAKGACCKSESKKCEPSATNWTAPQWVALMFSVDDPHYYSYEYKVSDDGKTATAYAYGDLDCDGEYSTFSLSTTVGPDGPTVGKLEKVKQTE